MVGVQPRARTHELLLDCGQTNEHTENQTFLDINRQHLTHCGMCLVNLYYTFLCK